MDLAELAHTVASSPGQRAIVGIAGPPGGGKTTLARALCEATGFAHAPGDGFIIPDTWTDDAGHTHERGAVSGFDTAAYAAMLAEVAGALGSRDVEVPNYRHTQDGAGDRAFVVPAAAAGVVTECNFLASPSHGWPDIRAALTTLVYLDESWEVCRPRLISRQLAKRRTQREAEARVDSHDHANYLESVAHAASTADITFSCA